MSRVKGRERITMSLSPDVLAVVDAHAQTVGLDRYDVIRNAISKGVVVLRIEHELLMDRDGGYTLAMIKAAAGQGDTEEHLRVLGEGVEKGLERDVPGGPHALKSRGKRVNPDAK
jgi:hypothetical protein